MLITVDILDGSNNVSIAVLRVRIRTFLVGSDRIEPGEAGGEGEECAAATDLYICI
jgi:hypothetical protein